MDFSLTQEQQMFRDMVHEFAEKELKPRARHNEAAEFNAGPCEDGAAGAVGLAVPERYDGAGVDAVGGIAIEQIGWGCVDRPGD
jgi:alkylation response protein AidB-like acyl-CoA dehydrogenase